MDHYRLFIGGELVEARDGARFDSVDPGTGAIVGSVASAGDAEVDDAVDAARRAFDGSGWRNLTPTARGEILMEMNGQRVLVR